jgi:hypothetical protein
VVPPEEISNNPLGGKDAGPTFAVYGAIIVAIARFQSRGILTLVRRLWVSGSKTPNQPWPQELRVEARRDSARLRGPGSRHQRCESR